ncbi:MAG TPA: AraC family transcriptional regulator [Candidatus Saccharimonadia bacterium]|nr:AraC family transcriptional regulator [Candidatus Saccharimonadia bacterium]
MHPQEDLEKKAGMLARQMIEADFVNPPSLTTLAIASGMSPFQMSRLFYRVNQITIPHLIRKLRTDRAEELLRTTSQTIGQVAVEVGYMSMSAFCRAFFREKGRLPSDMRRDSPTAASACIAARQGLTL